MKKYRYIGVGIANAAWVWAIAAIIIFGGASPLWIVLPILFSWKFDKNESE